MKVKALSLFVAVIAIMALLVGCAKPPQADIDAAKAALDAARTAEADRYVPQKFNVAQDSVQAAMAEVERQNSKFALFRNYGNAQKMLVAAKSAAEEASRASEARKEEIRNEVRNTLAQAQAAITQAKDLMTKAPKGKEGRAALEAIANDLTMIEGMLTEANNALNSNDLQAAQDKSSAGLQKANAIITELQDAINKVHPKK